jgi:hypothetical protein
MTTKSRPVDPVDPDVQAILDDLEHLGDRPLAYITALGRRLAELIPEEERQEARAETVAWLDEIAAREPSRPPDPASK